MEDYFAMTARLSTLSRHLAAGGAVPPEFHPLEASHGGKEHPSLAEERGRGIQIRCFAACPAPAPHRAAVRAASFPVREMTHYLDGNELITQYKEEAMRDLEAQDVFRTDDRAHLSTCVSAAPARPPPTRAPRTLRTRCCAVRSSESGRCARSAQCGSCS